MAELLPTGVVAVPPDVQWCREGPRSPAAGAASFQAPSADAVVLSSGSSGSLSSELPARGQRDAPRCAPEMWSRLLGVVMLQGTRGQAQRDHTEPM